MYSLVGNVSTDDLSVLNEMANDAKWKIVKSDERDYETAYVDAQNLFPQWDNWHSTFFLKIPPGGKVHRHIDAEHTWETYHVVVKTNDRCLSYMDDGAYKLEIGNIYWVDRSVLHWSVNDGETDRLHLLCEVYE